VRLGPLEVQSTEPGRGDAYSPSAESALDNAVYMMKREQHNSLVFAYLGFLLPRKPLDLEMERDERDFYGEAPTPHHLQIAGS